MADDVSTPTVRSLHTYLRYEGWDQQAGGPAGAMWTKDGRRIGVPSDGDDELIMGVVRRLATFSNHSVKETADAIRFLLFDVTYLRVEGRHSEADAIPLGTATRVLGKAKAMLRAAATTARTEQAEIGRSYSSYGDGVVRDSHRQRHALTLGGRATRGLL